MRIAIFDLETSGLEGDVGRILCGSVMNAATGEMKSFRNDKVKKKRRMVRWRG